MKDIIIHCTKCVLILSEQELLKNLPPGILETALCRGKTHKRLERVSRYEKSRADWMDQDIYGRDSP